MQVAFNYDSELKLLFLCFFLAVFLNSTYTHMPVVQRKRLLHLIETALSLNIITERTCSALCVLNSALNKYGRRFP